VRNTPAGAARCYNALRRDGAGGTDMPTPIRRLAIAVGVATLAITAVVYAQNLQLRTGEWEFTLTGLGSAPGAATLTPQARAQLEQPQHYKSCLTEQDLAELNLGPPQDEDEDCRVTSHKVSGKTADITRTCRGDEERTEQMHIEAPSNERMHATIEMTSARGKAHLTIDGKWVGAMCTDSD
jgi:hypothetical protein